MKRRISERERGRTHSTKRMGELKLIYYEAFISEKDARKQERFYKSGYGREVLRDKLENTLKKNVILKVPSSSNGRTADSESANLGSSPRLGTLRIT